MCVLGILGRDTMSQGFYQLLRRCKWATGPSHVDQGYRAQLGRDMPSWLARKGNPLEKSRYALHAEWPG